MTSVCALTQCDYGSCVKRSKAPHQTCLPQPHCAVKDIPGGRLGPGIHGSLLPHAPVWNKPNSQTRISSEEGETVKSNDALITTTALFSLTFHNLSFRVNAGILCLLLIVSKPRIFCISAQGKCDFLLTTNIFFPGFILPHFSFVCVCVCVCVCDLLSAPLMSADWTTFGGRH